MIVHFIKSIIKNIQVFFIIWLVVLIANQVLAFRGCFAVYCLIAGLPHTGVIAAVITFLLFKKEKVPSKKLSDYSENKEPKDFTQITPKYVDYKKKKEIELSLLEDTEVPFCPKCGAVMKLRTAKQGPYAGNKFWGCSIYPKCDSIINM